MISRHDRGTRPSSGRPNARTQRARPRVLVALIASLGLLPACDANDSSARTPSAVQELQLDIPWSGRLQAIAVHPGDRNTVIAGADNGGLWKSTDGGKRFVQLAGFPSFAVIDVRFCPRDPSVVLATAAVDTRVRAEPGGPFENGGGIWRSSDGGLSWSHAMSAQPSCTTLPTAAYGIAFAPDSNTVYVGTDCGLAVSTNQGSDWKHFAIAPGSQIAVLSVVASAGGVVDVHTTDAGHGHYRSRDGGHTFVAPCLDVIHNDSGEQGADGRCDQGLPPAVLAPENYGNHSLARAQRDDLLFGAAMGLETGPRYRLYESDDRGASWQSVDPPETGRPPNRVPLVVVSERDGGLEVIFGDGQRLVGQHCNARRDTHCRSSTEAWTALDLSAAHSDPSDVALDPRTLCPLYMANDGGLSRSGDCGASWAMIGTGAKGIHALELYDITGQVHPAASASASPLPTDLYLSTQDDNLWASTDGGKTWPGSVSSEGLGLQVPHSSIDRTDVLVVGTRCSGCTHFVTGPGFSGGIRPFVDPPNLACPDTDHDGACDLCEHRAQVEQAEGGSVWRCDPRPVVDELDNLTGARVKDGDGIADGPSSCLDEDGDGICDGRPCRDRVDARVLPDIDLQTTMGGPDGRCDPRPGAAASSLSPRLVSAGVYLQWDEGGISTHRNADLERGSLGGDCMPDSSCNAGLACFTGTCAGTLPHRLFFATNGEPRAPHWIDTLARYGGDDPRQALFDEAQVSGDAAHPVLFQAAVVPGKNGDITSGLLRIDGIGRSGGARVQVLPDLGFVALSPAQLHGQYAGFGVDPVDPQRALVLDLNAGMRITHDGGASWTVLPQLTKLVSQGDELTAEHALHITGTGGATVSEVTTIAYDPTDPKRILIGTQSGGIVASLDAGESWARLCRSEQVPRITSFFFDEVEGNVYASSFGRGLWKVFPNQQQRPVFTAPPHDIVAHDCGPIDIGHPVAEDFCEELGVHVTNDAPGCEGARPCGVFARGRTRLHWTAEDDAGNLGTRSSAIEVDDRAPPIHVSAPPPITLALAESFSISDLDPDAKRAATDRCQGAIALDQWRTEPALPAALPVGDTELAWYARDDLGNENPKPAIQHVTVVAR
jgi:hypothetical protein